MELGRAGHFPNHYTHKHKKTVLINVTYYIHLPGRIFILGYLNVLCGKENEYGSNAA